MALPSSSDAIFPFALELHEQLKIQLTEKDANGQYRNTQISNLRVVKKSKENPGI